MRPEVRPRPGLALLVAGKSNTSERDALTCTSPAACDGRRGIEGSVSCSEPIQLTIAEDGTVVLPLGVLAEAGLSPGNSVLAYSNGDGRIVLRREEDAVRDLIQYRHLD